MEKNLVLFAIFYQIIKTATSMIFVNNSIDLGNVDESCETPRVQTEGES